MGHVDYFRGDKCSVKLIKRMFLHIDFPLSSLISYSRASLLYMSKNRSLVRRKVRQPLFSLHFNGDSEFHEIDKFVFFSSRIVHLYQKRHSQNFCSCKKHSVILLLHGTLQFAKLFNINNLTFLHCLQRGDVHIKNQLLWLLDLTGT